MGKDRLGLEAHPENALMAIKATVVPFFSFFQIAGMEFIQNEMDVFVRLCKK